MKTTAAKAYRCQSLPIDLVELENAMIRHVRQGLVINLLVCWPVVEGLGLYASWTFHGVLKEVNASLFTHETPTTPYNSLALKILTCPTKLIHFRAFWRTTPKADCDEGSAGGWSNTNLDLAAPHIGRPYHHSLTLIGGSSSKEWTQKVPISTKVQLPLGCFPAGRGLLASVSLHASGEWCLSLFPAYFAVLLLLVS